MLEICVNGIGIRLEEKCPPPVRQYERLRGHEASGEAKSLVESDVIKPLVESDVLKLEDLNLSELIIAEVDSVLNATPDEVDRRLEDLGASGKRAGKSRHTDALMRNEEDELDGIESRTIDMAKDANGLTTERFPKFKKLMLGYREIRLLCLEYENIKLQNQVDGKDRKLVTKYENAAEKNPLYKETLRLTVSSIKKALGLEVIPDPQPPKKEDAEENFIRQFYPEETYLRPRVETTPKYKGEA